MTYYEPANCARCGERPGVHYHVYHTDIEQVSLGCVCGMRGPKRGELGDASLAWDAQMASLGDSGVSE